ncbi:hypothetical protein TNCV_690511 [Trichonephila clavipes]|nr:hypothetical protein TNCV_690511 [Trichonephila clavipes]
MATGSYLTPIYSRSQSEVQGDLHKGENASQVAEILNGVYDADTVTANYEQFWFRHSVQAFLISNLSRARHRKCQ